MDTADWIRAQRNGVSCSTVAVCMRGITSAMQRPIFPFPAREHRYLEPAILPPKSTNQRRCRRVDDHEFRAGMQLTGHNCPSTFPDLTPQLAAT